MTLSLPLWLAAAPPALAQDTLTLDSALQEALAHNAALRAARSGADAASEHVTEARAGWLPRLSVAETWQRGDAPIFVFGSLLSSRKFTAAHFAIDALNRPDPIAFFQTSVGAEQPIFDGGRLGSAVRAARLRSNLAKLAVDESTGSVATATAETYGRILIAEAAARAAHDALESAREDTARAERRRGTGMATDADVLALAARVAVLRQDEIDRQADAAVARAELNRLMGSSIDRSYHVSEPAAGLELSTLSLSEAFAEADANRPELKRAEASIRLAEAERNIARAALIPQLTARAAVELNGTTFNSREASWIAGGELQWNLSLGGAERARARAASDAQIRAAAEADEMRAGVRVEIATAFQRLEAARARQAVGRAAVDQARERLRIIRDRFDAGIAGVTDVLQASSALTDAEAQRIGAIVDATTSEARLRRAIGRHP